MDSIILEQADFIDTGEVIGRGAFADVKKYRQKKTNTIYAAKQIKDIKIGALETEIKALIKIQDHPTTLKLLGYIPNGGNDPIIVTEYMENGSLDKMLEKERDNNAPSSWTKTKKYIALFGIAIGMDYLHREAKIMHRDLKPANILLDSNLNPKISDFGLSKLLVTDSLSYCSTSISTVGTIMYMAPEITGNNSYNKMVDVFSFSYIAYELFSGKFPFEEKNIFAFINNRNTGKRPNLENILCEKQKVLLLKMWENDPKDRISFQEIIDFLLTEKEIIPEDVDIGEIAEYLSQFDLSFKYSIENRKDSLNNSIVFSGDNIFHRNQLLNISGSVGGSGNENNQNNGNNGNNPIVQPVYRKYYFKEKRVHEKHDKHSALGFSRKPHTHFGHYQLIQRQTCNKITDNNGNISYTQWVDIGNTSCELLYKSEEHGHSDGFIYDPQYVDE